MLSKPYFPARALILNQGGRTRSTGFGDAWGFRPFGLPPRADEVRASNRVESPKSRSNVLLIY